MLQQAVVAYGCEQENQEEAGEIKESRGQEVDAEEEATEEERNS
jgi:hypothetical protein